MEQIMEFMKANREMMARMMAEMKAELKAKHDKWDATQQEMKTQLVLSPPRWMPTDERGKPVTR
jgi:hypothetical protein